MLLVPAPLAQNALGGSPGSPTLEPDEGQRVAILQTEPSALQNIADTAGEIVDRMNLLFSPENVARVTKTLDQVEQITGTVAAERDEIAALIRNARSASERLETTLANADRTLVTLDQGVVQELPALVERLDRTLAQLESASKNADGILSDNREAIAAFSNDGLGQVGPTMRQMRSLIRELDDLAGKVQGNPASFLLGREQPEEFDP